MRHLSRPPIGSPIEIVMVEANDLGIYLAFEVVANTRVVVRMGNIPLASIRPELIIKTLRDQVHLIKGLESAGQGIHSPVSDTVSDRESSQIVGCLVLHFCCLVPIVDLVR